MTQEKKHPRLSKMIKNGPDTFTIWKNLKMQIVLKKCNSFCQ